MRKRLAIIFIASLLLNSAISMSQDDAATNLLTNGDFEGGFVALDGAEPRNLAESWVPWHVAATDSSPSFANHAPNYDEETDRTRLGPRGKAQKYFTLFATHQGGIYQEVDSLTSGTTYRFSIYAYVWSSSFEDTDLSEDPGDVVVRVGIDPNGGTDGASDDIIWSTAATFFYDAYRQYAVIATAESSSITVFVESTVGEPRSNNFIYLDDALLEVASETVVVVEHTPTSETKPEPATEMATSTAAPTDEAQEGESADDDSQNGLDVASATPLPTLTPIPTATPTETALPTPSPTPTVEATTAADAADFVETVTHVVVAEDTVSALAQQYGSTVDAIRRANDLDAKSLIVVGQRLIIPLNPLAASVEGATATPTLTPTFTPTMTPTPTATPITYQVQRGDTLLDIALLYGTTVELLSLANSIVNPHQIDVGQILLIPTAIPPTLESTIRPTVTLYPTDGPTPDPAVATAAPSWYTVYVVQVGDTLDAIAREHGVTVQDIVELSGIADASRIAVGQEIKIPSPYPTATPTPTITPQPTLTPLPTAIPVTYFVQVGDTISSIASRYAVSALELAQINGFDINSQLAVGQVLTIPG